MSRFFGNIAEHVARLRLETLEKLRQQHEQLELAQGEAVLWELGCFVFDETSPDWGIYRRLAENLFRVSGVTSVSFRPTEEQASAWIISAGWVPPNPFSGAERRTYPDELQAAFDRARSELGL